MAESTVASSVVPPDAPPSPSAPTLKRRQSSLSPSSPKRARISVSPSQHAPKDATSAPQDPDTAPPSATHAIQNESPEPPTHPDSTRKPSRTERSTRPVDEKKRSQRLFGALLGPQKPTSVAQKRRAEIEDRKREEAKRKEEELSKREEARLRSTRERRRREQREVDEVGMRLRHANLLATANFLSTAAEPKLFYRPWDLRPDEEERIKRQREDAEELVEGELQEFDEKMRRWREEGGGREGGDGDQTKRDGKQDKGTNGNPAEQDREGGTDGTAEDAAGEAAQEGATAETAKDELDGTAGRERKQSIDDTGDVIVEADEDTVIY